MAGYSPLRIVGNSTGLVQEREEFLLPDDAYPILQNAYVWRERIRRKKGFQLLGRLQRNFTISGGTTGIGQTNFVFNVFTSLGINLAIQPNATVVPGSISYSFGAPDAATWTDNGDGTVSVTGKAVALGSSINYLTGDITFISTPTTGGAAITFSASYNPNLPVMGIRIEEVQNSANDTTIFFDQLYAYVFDSAFNRFREFITGTTWNAAALPPTATDFFFSTNFWVSGTANTPFSTANNKLFWVTNNSGHSLASADPPRITDGVTWVNFFPSAWSQIDATNFLTNWLAMLPFRGRMVTFNTWEGVDAATSKNYSNRIRWSTIGNPFIPYAAGPPAKGSWRSDIRGQGGFLDIPTSEDIVAVGFVRDNLVIYCERSTWQLRYTGRSIAPFQIERVNSELGAEGTFSAIQFDTSLLGIGDKGVVECDSYKSERIDIKIPDLVYQFQSLNEGVARVHGIRDFINRLAYWTFPSASANGIFPDQRLVYNYENDSWALFNDSLTTLGNYQAQSSPNWLNINKPWVELNFNWLYSPQADPLIVGGNQQGFVEILDYITVNDVSLYIKNIVGHGVAGPPITGTPTVVTSPNHNMQSGFVIQITDIPAADPYSNLNNQIFGITVPTVDTFLLWKYDPATRQFSNPQIDVPSSAFIGVGLIKIRENFSIKSKKFNFIDEGKSIQMGYLDILLDATEPDDAGEISLNVYLDYNDSLVSNTLPQNVINDGSPTNISDAFFNSTIPTTTSSLNTIGGTKFWQRVYCPTRANFITLEYTLSNAQMAGNPQTLDVQIDAQVLWIRKGGRLSQI